MRCCVCDGEVEANKGVILKGKRIVCFKCMGELSFLHENISEVGDTISMEVKLQGKSIKSSRLRPVDIRKELDQYVIGQDKAKKVLSVASYNHYKRCDMQDVGIKKSNILLIGQTGSGKTYLVETLAKILDVPFSITAATSLTEAGYIGDDVEVTVQKLLENANGDIKRAEKGIIFIDEIDKLTSSSSETKRQVGGKGVQQALLKLLEGCKVSVPVNGSSDIRGMGAKVDVDTTNILFICAGAFPDVENIIRKRLVKKPTLGFSSQDTEETIVIDEENLLLNVTGDDLREFGLIPEFLGRLPIIAPLEKLTQELLVQILVDPKDSIVSQYVKLFEYDEILLNFEREALEEIASKAIKKGTGARSLRSVLEELLTDIMYSTPSDDSIGAVTITKDFVCGISEPRYGSRIEKISATL